MNIPNLEAPKISENTFSLYNGEVDLFFNPAKHHYRANGEYINGVTTALGIIDKPQLMYWAVNMALEKVASAWFPDRAFDEIYIQNVLREAKRAHTVKRDKAADVGTLAHRWIESWCNAKPLPDPTNREVLNAVRAFKKFIKEHDFRPIVAERPVYSKKYKYAGTLDGVAWYEGKLVISDNKTSSGIYDSMFAQMGGYHQALIEEFPNLPIEGHLIINCTKEGDLNIGFSNNTELHRKVYLRALGLWRDYKELKESFKNSKEAYNNYKFK